MVHLMGCVDKAMDNAMTNGVYGRFTEMNS